MPAAWIGLGATVIGGVLGFGQAQKQDRASNDAVDAQNEYNAKMYEYNIDERDRLYDYSMDQTNIARNNTLNNINYQEELLRDDWKFREELSIRDYNNQVAAFNKSEQIFDKQVQYNTLAADQAYQENALQLFEREVSAQFNLEKVESTLGRQLADAQYKKGDLNNIQKGRRQDTAFSKAMKGLQLRSTEAETAANIQDSRLRGMAAKGALMARGQSGNSIKKGAASIGVSVGVQQARLVDGLVKAESEFKIGVMKDEQTLANSEFSTKNAIATINTATQYNKYDADQGRRQINETVKSAQRSFNQSNMKIANDMFGANLKADAQRRSMPSDRIETPKPLALPRPDIQDPYKPGDPPEPIENAQPGNINTLGALAGTANNLAGLNWAGMLNKP